MHLFALSIYSAGGLSLVLGAVVFICNAIFQRDREYEARFPWWVRLSSYLFVLLIPPIGWSRDLSDTRWWIVLLLTIVGFAVPLVGLLSSLWLAVFRKTRERVKLAKGLLLVSLVPIAFVVGTSIDPNTRVVYSHRYSGPLVKESEAGAQNFHPQNSSPDPSVH
jgi:H+/Cl- antiporter ClcA